jgi:hypothetical protein
VDAMDTDARADCAKPTHGRGVLLAVLHPLRQTVSLCQYCRKLALVLLQQETTMNRGGGKILVVINGNNNKNSNACTTQVTSLENAAIDISGLLN